MKVANEKKVFLKFQKDEATAVLIYGKLSRIIKDENNSKILARIASEEAGHYETFRSRTGEEVRPRRVFAFAVVLLARILGITFALKMLEKGEGLPDYFKEHIIYYAGPAKGAKFYSTDWRNANNAGDFREISAR